jgi:hypothetical protein
MFGFLMDEFSASRWFRFLLIHLCTFIHHHGSSLCVNPFSSDHFVQCRHWDSGVPILSVSSSSFACGSYLMRMCVDRYLCRSSPILWTLRSSLHMYVVELPKCRIPEARVVHFKHMCILMTCPSESLIILIEKLRSRVLKGFDPCCRFLHARSSLAMANVS